MLSNLCRINCTKGIFSKIFNLNATACCYSRRSNSKNADSVYKVVKSKIRLDDDLDMSDIEGGANWELFAPRGNRFYLPGLLGPAWQGTSSTQPTEIELEKLIDFQSKETEKLHVSSKVCPMLLRNNLHELFPAPEVFSKVPMTMITLSSLTEMEVEDSAKNFVLAAREICTRLRLSGYWADFMNPFSGKPFYSYTNGRKLYKIDHRFRGIDIKLENRNDCLVISSNEDVGGFSASIFTNAPTDLITLEEILSQ